MTISARCSGVLNDQNSRPSLPRFDSPAVHLNEGLCQPVRLEYAQCTARKALEQRAE